MDKNAQLEARVWSRIMGETLEIPKENDDLTSFLRSEYADLYFYRHLAKKFPNGKKILCMLIESAESTIKYLKTMYFVENGRCYKEKYSDNICISCICQALRQQYKTLQKRKNIYEKRGGIWEKAAWNKAKEERLVLMLLEGLL